MRITESQLRRIIRQEVRSLREVRGPVDPSADNLITQLSDPGRPVSGAAVDKTINAMRRLGMDDNALLKHVYDRALDMGLSRTVARDIKRDVMERLWVLAGY